MRKNLEPMMSSKRSNWQTPKWLIKELTEEHGILYDPCPSNHLIDGLELNFPNNQTVFINPPYGRGKILPWVRKAIEEWKKGCKIIMLLPSRTDQKWFHLLLKYNVKIIYFPFRLHFDEHKNGSPFCSFLAYFE